MKRFLLIAGILLLFAAEISRVYYIMPFPGSQKHQTISYAYWIGNNIVWIRIVLLLLIIIPFINSFKNGNKSGRIFLSLIAVFYAVIFFLFNFKFQADKMFYQPVNKIFTNAGTTVADSNKLVIGVVVNGEAKAFPLQVIGYHHQVRDTIGGKPLMITYCTVCRTGRVFIPAVKGKSETFRLVGMDHFNAMFEDATTKSWWQQATGVAVAGPLKGQALQEYPSRQLALRYWLMEYPNSTVLQPDTVFNERYKSLAGYDRGNVKDDLEKRDSASWQFKSWVIGVDQRGSSKAYDWNELVSKKIIQDSLPGLPLLITIENDTASFHVFDRTVEQKVLSFKKESGLLLDLPTGSVWNMEGKCVDGALKGAQLKHVQAYQEFWHSWHTFHPRTVRYQ
ncbi:MAG: DUF3179 domain-containing protein [Chitinophagaceae bacterium]|nr:DUF3179 domain-containing protein [Chitinophagaceae bacterium]